jgi:hypothetical protein
MICDFFTHWHTVGRHWGNDRTTSHRFEGVQLVVDMIHSAGFRRLPDDCNTNACVCFAGHPVHRNNLLTCFLLKGNLSLLDKTSYAPNMCVYMQNSYKSWQIMGYEHILVSWVGRMCCFLLSRVDSDCNGSECACGLQAHITVAPPLASNG